MEQAVNQFNKGLQKDTNPMVQSNDTLSDALNATFITMNGNEVILQNDMGNRRIDNAYLPSGYTPVGMKEYGGIIYVAAYNPITNKSQIGSFPSPERKISSNDSEMGNNLDLSLLTKGEEVSSLVNLPCIKSDTILIPLTKDTSLHAGDKFVVFGDGILNIKSDLTNYNNVKDDKVCSPKNKKYTLALGILNSQNEFVDITKSLVRWNNEDTTDISLIEDNSKSDLYNFNNGYFIAVSNPTESTNTKDDAKLIEERLTYPANTYAYKLVGPLYIQAKLNHIQEFSYNIYGTYNKSAKLWIEAQIIYNCPDGVTANEKVDDPNYYTYEEGKILNSLNYTSALSISNKIKIDTGAISKFKGINSQSFYNKESIVITGAGYKLPSSSGTGYIPGKETSTADTSYAASAVTADTSSESTTNSKSSITSSVFDFYKITTNEDGEKITLMTVGEEKENFSASNTKYDPSTNLYTCKMVKKYEITESDIPEDGIFNYILGVKSDITDNKVSTNGNNISYLSGLSTKGSIDLNLLGSGTVILKGWRFYNYYNEGKTILTYNFDAYPEYGKQFNNLSFIFTNVKDWTDIIVLSGTINNGRNSITFDWKKFRKNALYRVTWTYQQTDISAGLSTLFKSEDNEDKTQKDRWFLTTELFNECYNANADKFIEDYGNPNDYSSDYEKMYDLFNEVMNQYYLEKGGKTIIVDPNVEGSIARFTTDTINEINKKVKENKNSNPNYRTEYLNEIYNNIDNDWKTTLNELLSFYENSCNTYNYNNVLQNQNIIQTLEEKSKFIDDAEKGQLKSELIEDANKCITIGFKSEEGRSPNTGVSDLCCYKLKQLTGDSSYIEVYWGICTINSTKYHVFVLSCVDKGKIINNTVKYTNQEGSIHTITATNINNGLNNIFLDETGRYYIICAKEDGDTFPKKFQLILDSGLVKNIQGYYNKEEFEKFITANEDNNYNTYLTYTNNIDKYYNEIENSITFGNLVEAFNNNNKEVQYTLTIPDIIYSVTESVTKSVTVGNENLENYIDFKDYKIISSTDFNPCSINRVPESITDLTCYRIKLSNSDSPYIKVYWNVYVITKTPYHIFVVTRNGEPIRRGDIITYGSTETYSVTVGNAQFYEKTRVFSDSTENYCIVTCYYNSNDESPEKIENITLQLSQSLQPIKCVQSFPSGYSGKSITYGGNKYELLLNEVTSEIEVWQKDDQYIVTRKDKAALNTGDIIIYENLKGVHHIYINNEDLITTDTVYKENAGPPLAQAVRLITIDEKKALYIKNSDIKEITLLNSKSATDYRNYITNDEFWRNSLISPNLPTETLKDLFSNNELWESLSNSTYFNWPANAIKVHDSIEALQSDDILKDQINAIFKNTDKTLRDEIFDKYNEEDIFVIDYPNGGGDLTIYQIGYLNNDGWGDFIHIASGRGKEINKKNYLYLESTANSATDSDNIYNTLDRPLALTYYSDPTNYPYDYDKWNVGDTITIYFYSSNKSDIIFTLADTVENPVISTASKINYKNLNEECIIQEGGTLEIEDEGTYSKYKFEYTFTDDDSLYLNHIKISHPKSDIYVEKIVVKYADPVSKLRCAISKVVDDWVIETLNDLPKDGKRIEECSLLIEGDADAISSYLAGSTTDAKGNTINNWDDIVSTIKLWSSKYTSNLNRYSFTGSSDYPQSYFISLDRFNEKKYSENFTGSSRQGDWIRALCKKGKELIKSNESAALSYWYIAWWIGTKFTEKWGYQSWETDYVLNLGYEEFGNAESNILEDYELNFYDSFNKSDSIINDIKYAYITEKYTEISKIVKAAQIELQTRETNKSAVLESLNTSWYKASHYIDDAINSLTTGEVSIFNALGEFEYTIDFGDSISENIQNINTEDKSLYSGKASIDTFITGDTYYQWKWSKTHTIDLNFSPKLNFNSELYPSYIEFPKNYTILQDNPTSTLDNVSNEYEQSELINISTSSAYLNNTIQKAISQKMKINGSLSQTITVETVDYYWDTAVSLDKKGIIYFVSLYNYLTQANPSNLYVEIWVDQDLIGGHDDDHYIMISRVKNGNLYSDSKDDSFKEASKQLTNDEREGSQSWSYSDYRIYTMISGGIQEFAEKFETTTTELIIDTYGNQFDKTDIQKGEWGGGNQKWSDGSLTRPTAYFKNINDHWVIFNKKLSSIQSVYNTYFYNLYFARYLNTTLEKAAQLEGAKSPVYPSTQSYIKTKKYVTDLIFDTKLYLKPDTMIINGPDGELFSCTYPTFQCKYNKIPYSKTFKITNSDRFIDEVLNYDPDNTTNIYSRFGDKDFEGNYLSSKSIYRLQSDGKLHKVSVPYTVIETENDMQTLRYKGGKINSEYNRYIEANSCGRYKDKDTILYLKPCDDNINVIYPYQYYADYDGD